MRIAFLGLGIMGKPMAANLAKAGYEVTVWNRTEREAPAGTQRAATPRQAALGADVVWICVADTNAVRDILFGEQGVESALRPGMVVVDSSTISPMASKEFAERVRKQGSEFVDAPVTGSKTGAEAGQLIFIVGGREETLAKLSPLFRAMGKQVSRMGENGMGLSAKLAINLMIALIYEGFAEGMTLAAKLGVDAEALLSLIQTSMVRSGVVDYKGPFVLRRDFSPNFPMKLMYKDIKLMLEAGESAGVKLPALKTVEELYAQASREGDPNLDYAASIMLLEKWAGVEVGAKTDDPQSHPEKENPGGEAKPS